MKAISLLQPWASLLVTRQRSIAGQVVGTIGQPRPMVKRFETRSWPCPPALIGQPIAIHATQRKPTAIEAQDVGDYQVQPDGNGGFSMRHVPTAKRAGEGQNLLATLYPAEIGKDYGYTPLPLGAVVGSGRITAGYPIVAPVTAAPLYTTIQVEHDGRLTFWEFTGDDWDDSDISDQLPYGDFTPGRFAWLIEDAAPCTERCPWCWGSGAEPDSPIEECRVCHWAGCCDPIPARGAQRIFNWTPTGAQA